MSWLSLSITVLGTASIFAIMGLGIVLVYRTSRVLAFHLGEVGALSAYVVATVAQNLDGLPALAAAIAAILIVAILLGLVSYYLVEVAGAPFGHFTGTVITIAIGIVAAGIMSMLWGGETLRIGVFSGSVSLIDTLFPVSGLAVAGIGISVVCLLVIAMNGTGVGLEMRALANNRTLAVLRGIPVRRTLFIVWLTATTLAAIAGALLASISVASSEVAIIGVSAIVAAIIGGLTSIWGCIIGALLLAIAETGITVFFEPRYAQVVPVLLLLILLTVRPSGLSDQAEDIARV